MTVVLGAASGGYCQYVRVIEGTTPIRYHVKAGTRRCLARSTLGRVLLAMEPPDRRARLIAEGARGVGRRRGAAARRRKSPETWPRSPPEVMPSMPAW